MKLPGRSGLEACLSASAVAAVAALAIAFGIAAPLERLVGDALVRLAAARPPTPPGDLPDVALVAIDAQSVRALPDWPWPRSVYAHVVRKLDAAGAKAIAIDIDLSVAREPAHDAKLTSAIAQTGRVVLAAFRQLETLPGGAQLEVASLPTPLFADRAAGIGSVLMPVEPDGVVRFAPRSSRIAEREVPSLAVAALAVARDEPVPPAGPPLRLDWRRASPAVRSIPLIDVVEGRFDPALVAGRVVMIGATAAEFQDLWSTPLAPARPGVWIQAIAYRTLAAEQASLPVLAAPGHGVAVSLAALLGVLAASLSQLSHARRSAALAAIAGAWLLAAAALVVSRGLLLGCEVPVAQLAAHYLLGLERVRQRFQRRLIERERSLVTLFSVGEAATAPASGDVLGVALSLLGDVVNASGVALLRASPEGELDGRRVDWGRAGGGAAWGDEEAAADCLRSKNPRVYAEGAPGSSGAGLAVYMPLFAGDVPVGVLLVEREQSEALDPTQLRTIATVGAQIALSVENLRLVEGLRATFDSSVEAIASAVEARDGYTQLHCRRLALFSGVMAQRLGLTEAEIEAIRLGALLHDVGKIGIRDEILLKPGRFTQPELKEMQRHADIGHRIVSGIHGLAPSTLACVRHHHECWDGSGYPSALCGDAIPLAARIVTVVDVWDALSTKRPYKAAYQPAEVRRMLRKARGERFEPELVDLFLRLLDEEGEELLGMAARSAA
jgi:HD-GYP domain-containing protein (c-di-GMP phosphodiesterase class II)/CHASE2 domain-containing sensor protein